QHALNNGVVYPFQAFDALAYRLKIDAENIGSDVKLSLTDDFPFAHSFQRAVHAGHGKRLHFKRRRSAQITDNFVGTPTDDNEGQDDERESNEAKKFRFHEILSLSLAV